jgi:hypothetical protein
MQLLDDLKETRKYWKLKEEAQDRTRWRTQFGRELFLATCVNVTKFIKILAR